MKIIPCCHQLKMLIMIFKGSDKMWRAAVEEMNTSLHVLWNTVCKAILWFISDTRCNLWKTRHFRQDVIAKKLAILSFLSGLWGHYFRSKDSSVFTRILVVFHFIYSETEKITLSLGILYVGCVGFFNCYLGKIFGRESSIFTITCF